MPSKELMLKVFRMSHISGMFNGPIADQLVEDGDFTSPNTKKVQQLLDEAAVWLLKEQERLAEIEGDDTLHGKLGERLCKKFGLLDAQVVPGGEVKTADNYADLIKQYGRAAAKYIDDLSSVAEHEKEDLHVSVAGGQTVLDIVSSLPDRKRPNVHFYASALIGRGRKRTAHVGPETTATIAWARSGRMPGHLYYGTVPPHNISKGELEDVSGRARQDYARELITAQLAKLTSDESIREVVDDMSDGINMAIAAIGLVNPAAPDITFGASTERLTITQLLKLLGIDPALLAQEGAVGELSYSFFDAKGQSDPRWRFFLTAGDASKHRGVDFYRRLVERKRPVIVAAAMRKEAALVPALKAKLLNVLVTDAFTADRLLGA